MDLNEQDQQTIETYVLMIHSSFTSVQLEGLIGIRSLLEQNNNNSTLIFKTIETGVIPKLLELMMCEDEFQAQFESSWIILNISSRENQFVDYITELGGLDIIIYLLDSEKEEIINHALWAMANIAGSRVSYRDQCLERGCMEKLIQIHEGFSASDAIIKSAVHSVSNLLHGQPLPDEKITTLALPIFHKHISNVHSEEALIDALWGICYISEHRIKEIINQGLIPLLMGHLNGVTSLQVLQLLLQILGKLIAETDPQFSSQIKEVVNSPQFLPKLFELATGESILIKKDAFWILSNIVAEDSDQIQRIIDNDDYMNILKNAILIEGPLISAEATWVVSNMFEQATSNQIDCLLKRHHILDIIAFLLTNIDDDELKTRVLQAVNLILVTGNGYILEIEGSGLVEIIRNLAENDEFAEEANLILQYFHRR